LRIDPASAEVILYPQNLEYSAMVQLLYMEVGEDGYDQAAWR